MTIAGHEEEFRLLFAQEAEMRLARLGEQLLQLETTGSDRELVASIFREAHTLKGAAAVVGNRRREPRRARARGSPRGGSQR